MVQVWEDREQMEKFLVSAKREVFVESGEDGE